MNLFFLVTRVCVGLVFGAAAVTKLRDAESRRSFAQSVAARVDWSDASSRRVALVVAAAEAAVALAVLAPVRSGPLEAVPIFGLLLASVLSLVFLDVVLRAIRKGDVAPCRCFGRRSAPMRWPHAIRNGSLAIVSAGAALGALRGDELHVDAMALTAGGLAGTVIALLVISMDDVLWVFETSPSMRASTRRTTS